MPVAHEISMGDTAHRASATGLDNGGGIVEVILVRFEVGLNKLSGNNLGLEPCLLKQASPVLRTGACLEGDPTRWRRADELFQLCTSKFLLGQYMPHAIESPRVF